MLGHPLGMLGYPLGMLGHPLGMFGHPLGMPGPPLPTEPSGRKHDQSASTIAIAAFAQSDSDSVGGGVRE